MRAKRAGINKLERDHPVMVVQIPVDIKKGVRATVLPKVN